LPSGTYKTGTFEQIGKDLNESKRRKVVLNTGEKQKNTAESNIKEDCLTLHSEIQNGFCMIATA
jgi:hypothetical protein